MTSRLNEDYHRMHTECTSELVLISVVTDIRDEVGHAKASARLWNVVPPFRLAFKWVMLHKL